MIIDNIKNAALYYGLGERIAAGLKFLENENLDEIEIGRHDIDGDNCFALVQEYNSKNIDEGFWEAHRKYIDIQYVVDGFELIGYTNIENLRFLKEYDEEKDFVMLRGDGDLMEFKVGTFGIFLPHDAHMPQISGSKNIKVRKVVVKVAV